MTRASRSRAGRAARFGGAVGAEAAKLAVHQAVGVVSPGASADRAGQFPALLADRLVVVLGSLRGVAMKLGQLLSLIDAGLLPPSERELFQETLARLQDSAPVVPWPRMRAHLEAELGGRSAAVFAEFDPEPVAAASIGQVYRARLADGRDVAVKVQYPDIEAAVRADLKNLRTLLSVYRLIHPALDTAALADELEARIGEELDYRLEAANTLRLAAAYRDHPFVRIPDVVSELCTSRVLVTDYLSGRPLREAYSAPPAERDRIAEILFRFYCGTPYFLRFYSADPHPGNVLLRDDGTVGFIDFGLCKAVDADTAETELAALRAGIDGDSERIVALMEARGFASRSSVSRDEAYATLLRVFGWYLRDGEVSFTPAVANDLVALLGFGANRTGSVRSFNLPAEQLLRGRTELQLVAMLGQLRPRTNLHVVAREWIFGEEPGTELGRAHRDWRECQRVGSAPSSPPTSETCQSASRSTETR
ncbi:Probable ubiquinone biosynthesis protein UbiB [Nocardia otitidiscaviarum]|uniref:Probable ubiquinone biosynthesis protein UbiB n=1 Tax=Nocardia otitidiscaviarum TaxID=1823 RepID=A0A379JGX9_9NOCA|nr:AarF/ABC1/UbiB kinase family protein [Nocardia otitidiscaviarum]SUD47705.1 Probable ubiquinone biosynthesis protein UbiB [Nocardia otitidiscaviarum]